MSLKTRIQSLLRRLLGIPSQEALDKSGQATPLTATKPEAPGEVEEVHSIWNFLKLKENTQAFHLTQVIGFEEWVDMEEIRRRIIEVFGIQYKNERSLYPHLKTLSDLGLFEITDVGGKRKWRKKEVLLRIQKKKSKKKAESEEARTPHTK